MEEFNKRMDAQRNILAVINKNSGNKEDLCGLSRKAIERWITANHLKIEGDICQILFKISEKLFFLANKSQEQITEEYRLVSDEILELKHNLGKAIEQIV